MAPADNETSVRYTIFASETVRIITNPAVSATVKFVCSFDVGLRRRRSKTCLGLASRMASRSLSSVVPQSRKLVSWGGSCFGSFGRGTRLIFAGRRAASEGSDRGCVASMSLRGPANAPRRVRVSRRPNPVRQTQSACPVSTLTGHSQSRRWNSLLGGRRTSAFPVDAPSILCLRSVLLSRDARLAQPLGQPVDVRLIAKWKPADVLGK